MYITGRSLITKKLLIAGLSACVLAGTALAFRSAPDRERDDHTLLKAESLFSSEDEFIEHIVKRVRFDSVDISVIEVRQGDNFWKIAKRHNVNIDTMLGCNPHWENLNARLKQHVIVPSQKGVIHFIHRLGEIDDIARIYKTAPESIIVQKLPFLYKYYYRFHNTVGPIAVFIKNARPTAVAMTDTMAKQFNTREMFRSPLGGRFSSFFGGRKHPIFRTHRFHNGVDIAARHGTLVGAASSGRIISSGWMGGYGKAVIIAHAKGYKTLYGHLSRITARTGQQVKAGQLIGRVGSTGWSTGPHLHFTLWHNGRTINPMNVLW